MSYKKGWSTQYRLKRMSKGICIDCPNILVSKRYCQNCVNKKTARYRKLKQEVLDHYGNKCVCCNEAIFEFLSIDHINNNGAAHRKVSGKGQNFYKWIIENNFPNDLQILCFNCNCAKGFYKRCPHEVAGIRL